MNKSTTWLSIFLIFATFTSLVMMAINNDFPHTRFPKNQSMDAFVTNIHFTQFNEQGHIAKRINAPMMKHFQSNNATQFNKPRILFYSDAGVPWHIHADHGKSLHGQKWIYLSGHVYLHHPGRLNNPATTITTSEITFYPEKSYAESKAPVKIVRPGTVITGVGMQAFLKQGKFKLLSHSKILYLPNATPK